MAITANTQVPPRSRTFTAEDGRAVLALFRGEAEGQDGKAAENVGFGEFDTPASARSAGVALNRLLHSLGADITYSVTTFKRGEKTVGVMLNKPAKVKKDKPATPAKNAGTGKSK